MNKRFVWLGLSIAVSCSMIALLFRMVVIASAEGQHPASPSAAINTRSGFISASTTLYFPWIQLSIPRPYVPPENTVAVVNGGMHCVWFTLYGESCDIVGEVMNTTSTPVYSVTVGQDLCDMSTRAVIKTDQAYTLLPEIGSHQLGSFGFGVSAGTYSGPPFGEPCGVSRVITWSTQISDSILPVTVLSAAHASMDPCCLQFVQVQGALRNDATHTLTPTVVAATLYDPAGYILYAQAYAATTPLAPGVQVPFTITFYAPFDQPFGNFGYYAVSAQGVDVP